MVVRKLGGHERIAASPGTQHISGKRFVVGFSLKRPHPVPGRGHELHDRTVVHAPLGKDRRSDGGVAQLRPLLVKAQRAERLEAASADKGIERAVPTHQHTDGTSGNLSKHLEPVGCGFVEHRGNVSPQVGSGVGDVEVEYGRFARSCRDLPKPFERRWYVGVMQRTLEDAVAGSGHSVGDAEQFGLRRRSARNQIAID